MWDQRYDTEDYVYGTRPNTFLATATAGMEPGDALSLAEGEGRNAVYLAGLGFRVTAVDGSGVGLAKARRLADTEGVEIETVVSDLADYRVQANAYDLVASIFCHVPVPVRQGLHRQVVAGLRPGGRLVLEAYTPDQLGRGTGGPPVAELMMTLDDLRRELDGLDFIEARETEREIVEGRLHTGIGAVVQVVAVKSGRG